MGDKARVEGENWLEARGVSKGASGRYRGQGICSSGSEDLEAQASRWA